MTSQQSKQTTTKIINNSKSARQSSIQGEGSIKRKLFSRKPAVNNISLTNNKIQKNVNLTAYQIGIPYQKQDFNSDNKNMQNLSTKINFVDRRQRQTQYFHKNKHKDVDQSFQSNKHIFFSPKNVKLTMHEDFKITQTYPIKNNHQFKQNQQRQPNIQVQTNTIQKQNDKNQSQKHLTITNPHLSFRQRSNTMLMPGLSFISPKSLSKYKQSAQGQKPEIPKINNLIQNAIKSQKQQCSFCKNSQQIKNILNQKCSRLQQKIKQKDKSIVELTDKLSSLQLINKQLNKDYKNLLNVKQQKDIEVHNLRQEFHVKIQQLKKQLSQIYEKMRYVDMENNVLLRYKDQYNLITKEYDMKHKENQQLRRIIANNRYGSYGNAASYQNKQYQHTKEVKINGNVYQHNNHQGNHQINYQVQNNRSTLSAYQQSQTNYRPPQQIIMYNINKNQDRNLSNQIIKQDDQISLTLSQRSYDQY